MKFTEQFPSLKKASDKWLEEKGYNIFNIKVINDIIQTNCFDKQKVNKIIDKLIEHRTNERKNNYIFRKSVDELNEDFIEDLENLKKEF